MLTGGSVGDECIAMLLDEVGAGLRADSTSRNALIALGWLMRGIAMCGHQSVQDCLRQVRHAQHP